MNVIRKIAKEIYYTSSSTDNAKAPVIKTSYIPNTYITRINGHYSYRTTSRKYTNSVVIIVHTQTPIPHEMADDDITLNGYFRGKNVAAVLYISGDTLLEVTRKQKRHLSTMNYLFSKANLLPTTRRATPVLFGSSL